MSPLIRRVPRQLIHNLGKYLGIFVLIAFTVAFISGFLNGAASIKRIMDEVPETYRLEDGRVTVAERLSDSQIEAVETGKLPGSGQDSPEAGDTSADLDDYKKLTLYPLFSHDLPTQVTDDPVETKRDIVMRVYTIRDEIDLAAVHEGRLPEASDEIAIDVTFARNHKVVPGDSIEVGGRVLKVSGLVTLPDYSTLFENNTDFVMDDLTFCVGLMTPEGYAAYADQAETYTYAIDFDDSGMSLADRTSAEGDLTKALTLTGAQVTDLVDIDSNQGRTYALDDLDSDSMMFRVFFYVIMAVMAFIFVVITGATIEDESPVIGTLLASGYTKGELVRHYLMLPTAISVLAVIVGSLGQQYFVQWTCAAYYNSYSLPPFVFHPDREVAIETTVLPVAVLFVITLVGLCSKLNYSPLAFLRHEATRSRRGKGVRLPEGLPFFTRFRLRVLLNNVGSIATIFIGVYIAGLLLLMGIGMIPLVDRYADGLASLLPAEHVYTLRRECELGDADAGAADQAEKVTLVSLRTPRAMGSKEVEVTVYGIEADSRYWSDVDVSGSGAVIGAGLAKKCGLSAGDTMRLDDPYKDAHYKVKVTGVTGEITNMNIYMRRKALNNLIGNDADAFNGWVSDKELHFAAADVLTDLTPKDMTKISDQMVASMGNIMQIFTVGAMAVFVVVIFLLSKTVMERSSLAVSQLKVFGYRDRELASVYSNAITISVVAALLLSIPLIMLPLGPLVDLMMMDYDVSIAVALPWYVYARYVLLALVSYCVVVVVNQLHLKRVPLALALKDLG